MDRGNILDAAQTAISQTRDKEYGDAASNFAAIANAWNAVRGDDYTFRVEDVAEFMIVVKLCRLRHSPNHLDSWMDIAGYAALGGELMTEGVTEMAKTEGPDWRVLSETPF